MTIPTIKALGVQPYEQIWQAMRDYTETRDANSEDQIWLVEHLPVFTQGIAGKTEHILKVSDIPIVQIDRGGQVTYHGIGQAVMYLLLDIKRAGVHIRPLVSAIENSVIELLRTYQIESASRADAPGVYIEGRKIASLGLKVRRGCTYHGVALNVDLDLEPFQYINPCGLVGMKMTRLKDFDIDDNVTTVFTKWTDIFIKNWQQLQQ